MQNARLVVPDLLQQAGLEAGDVLDNAPWSSLHGRTYTAEEEARIQERIERLALGLDVSDDEPKPQVISLEDALAEAVEPPVCKASAAPVSDSVVEKSQSQQSPQPEASTSKPKRVSRYADRGVSSSHGSRVQTQIQVRTVGTKLNCVLVQSASRCSIVLRKQQSRTRRRELCEKNRSYSNMCLVKPATK